MTVGAWKEHENGNFEGVCWGVTILIQFLSFVVCENSYKTRSERIICFIISGPVCPLIFKQT